VLYTYDSMNRLTAVETPISSSITDYTTYTYDLAGNITQMNAGGRKSGSTITSTPSTTTYTYDRFGNMLTEKNAANVTESYTYDLNGAMLSKTDRKGVPTLYTYDNRGRLLTETVGNLVHSYTYGLNGALLNESKAGSSLAYVYDGLGRLTQESHDGYVKNYAYNIGDLRTSFTLKNGSTTLLSNTYAYDALGQMTDVTGSGVSAEYGYDANGNLSGIYYNNTSSQTFSYNGLNMVDSIVMTGDGPYIGLNAADPGDGDVSLFSLNESLMDQITFDYDLAGRKIGSSSLFGDTKAYGYDPKGQLISESCSNNLHGSDYTKTYTYDPRGNRITLSDSGTSTAYTYNAVNHLQNSTTSGTATTYTYDANGNTLTDKVGSATATTYTYNADDQLTGISGAGLSVSYTYYPNGLRKTKTVNGVTTTYVWDGDQLVYESDVTQRKYVRGPLLAASVVGSTKTYYLYDDHGNVFVLTDDQYGAPVRVYAYDAFGNQLNIDPTDTNPFRYCGEYWDAETGSYYLRARYYDSSIGRFTQQDTYRGDHKIPLSLNYYIYCYNDPIRYVDSSGNIPIETTIDVISAASSLKNVIQDPSLQNLGFLAIDAIALAVPYVPGSYALKGINKLDDVADTVKVLRYGNDTYEVIDIAKDIANSKTLRNNMLKYGAVVPEYKHAAHHIVAGNSKYAEEARDVLTAVGISINHYSNGVFLPTVKGVSDAAYHPSLHTKAYYNKVNDLLSEAETQDEVIAVLRKIAKELQNGSF